MEAPLTLKELIEQSKNEERKNKSRQKRARTATPSSLGAGKIEEHGTKHQTTQLTGDVKDAAPSTDEPAADDAPQVRIGAHGGMEIVDEPMAGSSTHASYRRVESSTTQPVTAASFTTRQNPRRWSHSEVRALYCGIAEFGQDFSLIQLAKLPHKSRMQVKRKFRQEEREKPAKIKAVLEYCSQCADGRQYQWLHDHLRDQPSSDDSAMANNHTLATTDEANDVLHSTNEQQLSQQLPLTSDDADVAQQDEQQRRHQHLSGQQMPQSHEHASQRLTAANDARPTREGGEEEQEAQAQQTPGHQRSTEEAYQQEADRGAEGKDEPQDEEDEAVDAEGLESALDDVPAQPVGEPDDLGSDDEAFWHDGDID